MILSFRRDLSTTTSFLEGSKQLTEKADNV